MAYKLTDNVYRYNRDTRELEVTTIGDDSCLIPLSCWYDGAFPTYRRFETAIYRYYNGCRSHGGELVRDYGSEDIAMQELDELHAEQIVDSAHFDGHLTINDALEPAVYDCLDGPRDQVVRDLQHFARLGSELAAEWLDETDGMTHEEWKKWLETER